MKRIKEKNVNTPEYWKRYNGKTYKSNVRKTGEGRYVEVIKHINENSLILDVGCNFGDFLKYILDNEIPFSSYSGFDFSEIALDDAKSNFKDYEWILGDCHDLVVKEGFYNKIIAMQISEHLEEPIKFLKRAYQVLKIGGEIILTVPNKEKISHESHVWSFEKEDLLSLLEKTNFVDIDIKEIGNGRWLFVIAKKKDNKPKDITVVTCVLCPSKNVFTTIEKCFQSIRKAVDKVNAEWIIVDDGSAVGQDFFKNIADVYLKNEKTIGVSYSLNRGMKMNKSKFLVKLDSDYLVPENLFEVLLKDWSDDLCFITPSFTFGRPNDKKHYDINNIPKPEGGTIDKPSGMCRFSKYMWGGGIMMFNSKAMREVDYFDENFGVGGGQDNDIIYRMLMKGYNWRWSNNVLARHFASISSTDPSAPDSRGERRRIGKEYFKQKHGFEPGGFISNVYRHFKYDMKHLS